MRDQPTPEQARRRRRAAYELRQRAHDLLGDASRLDGLPAIRILMTDLKHIAEAAGCDPEKLTDAALALYPDQDDNHHRGEVMNIINATVERLLSALVERVVAPDRLAEAFEYGRQQGRREVIHEMAQEAATD